MKRADVARLIAMGARSAHGKIDPGHDQHPISATAIDGGSSHQPAAAARSHAFGDVDQR